jgi:hypothetical protein
MMVSVGLPVHALLALLSTSSVKLDAAQYGNTPSWYTAAFTTRVPEANYSYFTSFIVLKAVKWHGSTTTQNRFE